MQDAKRVVRLWEAEFAKAPMERQIAMLYLANDILQNSRRKGPEFINEFYHVMPRPISHLLRTGDAKASLSSFRDPYTYIMDMKRGS